MSDQVRPARSEDLAQIVPWTSDTFEWGDYVPQRFDTWLADSAGVVLVVPDEDDRPIALCHAVMLSSYEGWLEAARVHPEHRRSGLGSALNHAGVSWLSKRGARIIRLAVESENETARNQVEKLGYRRTSVWQHAELTVEGKSRCPPGHRLRQASPIEIDAAWVFWVGSDLAVAGRELVPQGWQWRRARPEDLVEAAKEGTLYQSASGWVVVRRPQPDWIQCGFVATTTEDAPWLLEGLHDLGREVGAEEVTVKLPAAPWTAEALIRAGADPKEIVVYAKSPG